MARSTLWTLAGEIALGLLQMLPHMGSLRLMKSSEQPLHLLHQGDSVRRKLSVS